jgi:hypothetical protein
MSFAGFSDKDREGLNTTQATQRGFDCSPGSGSYCGNQMGTAVGTGSDARTIFHRTKTTIDAGKASTEVYILSDGKWVNAAKTTDGGKTYTFNDEKRPDGSSIVGAGVRQSLASGGNMNKNVKAQVTNTLKEGGASLTSQPKLTDEQIKQTGAVDSNAANTDPNSDSSTEGADDVAKEAGTTNKNTRKTYQPDVKYPLNLKSENQDCIKFSIVEYKPPGLKPGASEAGSRIVTLNSSRPEITGEGRTILGTITLPIPGGIGDRNSADWSGNSLGEITKFFAGISMQGILGGGAAAGEAAQDSLGAAMPDGDTSSLQSRVAAAAVQGATGSSGILARQYGAVSNENLELLFNGPTLRNFAFNFRFTPREPNEAVAVRRIIRYFKQAMSVKRSESSLLLKTPHTFAISYLSKNKDHPYLNKFKECALTDCAVNYTPDGTYMTYSDQSESGSGDSSMTAYELSLTFQELVPIFDDDYFEIDKNQDTSIGF